MIIKLSEADLDRGELLERLKVLAGERRRLLHEMERGQKALEECLSEEEGRTVHPSAGGRGDRIGRWLREYTAGRTDGGDAAAAAALLIVLKFLEENAPELGLTVPGRMGMEPLSFLLPDRVSPGDLTAWISEAGKMPPALREAVPVLADPGGEALLSNLFRILEEADYGGEEGRAAALSAARTVDSFEGDFARRKGTPRGESGEAACGFLGSLSAGLGDSPRTEAAREREESFLSEKVLAILGRERSLEEALTAGSREILRLMEMME